MIEIDGSYLEGGGQIVRTAVALSAITGKEVKVFNIRKGREKPGLKDQHLHLISALKELCNAEVEGLSIGSEFLIFKPGKLKSKTLNIDVGTAGSVILLLQGLLLPCFFLDKPITIRIRGGTCTKWSTPVETFENVFIPQISDLCEKISFKQERRGYYPKGGGKIEVKIKPSKKKKFIEKKMQGKLVQIKCISHASRDLETSQVSERQARAAKNCLKKYNIPVSILCEYSETLSTGSGLTLWALFEDEKSDVSIILGADSLGEKGKKAEIVGKEAAEQLIHEIDSGACVDKLTVDALIPWLAIFGGSVKTSNITNHTLTNIYTSEFFIVEKFEVKDNIVTLVRQA